MKIWLGTVLICLLMGGCHNKAELIVVNDSYNIDTIAPTNEFIDIHHYIVNNTANSWYPDTVFSNCVCLASFYGEEPVKPGDTLHILTQLYSIYEQGPFNKTITVRTGLKGKQETILLKVNGYIDDSKIDPAVKYTSKVGTLWFKSTSFDFGTVKQGEIATATGEVYNAGQYPVTFTGIGYLPEYIQFDFYPRTIGPGETAQIKALYSAKVNPEIGNLKLDMDILTAADTIEPIIITTFVDVKEDFGTLSSAQLANAPVLFAKDTFWDYGTIPEGDIVKHEFIIENKGNSDLIIRKVESSCGCTAGVAGKRVLKPGEKTPVNVEFNSRNKNGNSRIYVRVITNDPNKTYVFLVVNGVVNPKADK